MPSHYTFHVTWSPEENEFLATCVEFPNLFWFDKDKTQALRSIRQVVENVVADMRANGEPVPESTVSTQRSP
jgi:predicted RNase H-like HicB family nuclease